MLNLFYNEHLYYLLCSCTNLLFGKYVVLEPLSHSDCGIFKSSIYLEQIDETASFFACWCKFTKIKSWFKSFWWGMVKNECGQSGLLTLKLTVSQERTDGTNWFFTYWYSFTQIKRWLKNVGVSMVKNECGQSDDGTQKMTVSEKWTGGINWLFACWYVITKILKADQNFLGGFGQKWVWPVWSQESKMNRWNKVFFSCRYKFRKAKNWFNYF